MSSAAPSIDLRPDHWAIVRGILRRHVPDRKVLAFGSRATWTAKDYSDLDLAIMGDKPLSLGATSALAEGFGESDLPFKVDVVDWAKIDEVFRNIIRRDGVAVQVPTGASKTTGRGRRSLATSRRSTMGGEWQEIPFSEVLAEPVRNGIYKRKEFHGRGFKIVNMGELFAYPRLGDVPMKRVELSETEKARFAVHAGDLLFARRSLVAEGAGKCSVVLDISEPTTFESSIIRARPNVAEADSLFLYYFFNSPQGLHALDSIRRQVAVAGITGGDLARLNVPKPPLSQQRAIAHILGTLDDKIELNRRMNETLEAMARALFKSWFVDFDPVRAKMEGRDTGLPQEIAELFPDRLVDSEIGEIPKGWKVGCVSDVCKSIENGGTPKRALREYWNGDVKWFKTSELVDEPLLNSSEHITNLGLRNSSCKLWPAGTVLIALYASPTVGRLGILEVSAAANQACCGLIVEPEFGKLFLFYLLFFGRRYFQNIAVGSAQQNISQQIVRNYQIVIPAAKISREFDSLVEAIYLQRVAKHSESRTLAVLRDILLPKLISGEIRVGDAEMALESVT